MSNRGCPRGSGGAGSECREKKLTDECAADIAAVHLGAHVVPASHAGTLQQKRERSRRIAACEGAREVMTAMQSGGGREDVQSHDRRGDGM